MIALSSYLKGAIPLCIIKYILY